MPRPRSYDRDAVVEVVKDAFWDHGYEGTALSELERRTGLNRSSLYLEFGSKQELFSAALDRYYDEIVDPLIGGLEVGAGFAAIDSFFAGVKRVILDESANRRRGCLLVNTIAELSAHDEAAARRARDFRDRLAEAFRSALEAEASRGRIDEASVARRAAMLLTGTLGIWLCVRIDPDDAMARCDDVAAEVHAWAAAPGAIRPST